MPLTNKRKFSLGVLGLMIGALGVDRFILGSGGGGPQTASASLPEPVSTGAASSMATQSASGCKQARSIACRLTDLRESLAESDQAGIDLFHDTPDWLVAPAAPAVSVVLDAAPVVDVFKDFASKHRLTSVMLGGSTQMVVIDGVCIKQGDRFAGVRLAKVEQGAATFEDGTQSVRLTVDAKYDTPTSPVTK